MKVTVQNGANHGLSRAEVEAMLRHFRGRGAALSTRLFCISTSSQTCFASTTRRRESWGCSGQARNAKVEAVEEMLVALSAIAERGSLPTRLGASLRQQYQDDVASVRAKCLEVIGEDAT